MTGAYTGLRGGVAVVGDAAMAPEGDGMNSESTLRRWMYRTLILLCVIACLAVIRRIVAVTSPPRKGPAQLVNLDQGFYDEARLTLAHIVPGMLFVTLLPFQFSRTFRNRHLRKHRLIGRILVVVGVIIGVTALAMSGHPTGGALENSAVYFYDTFFLISLIKAFVHARHREIAMHREWMIRANAILLGIATTRPVMGVFFATSRLTGLTPQQFFGVAFWIGFSFTYLAGEAWIRHTRANDNRKSDSALLVMTKS